MDKNIVIAITLTLFISAIFVLAIFLPHML